MALQYRLPAYRYTCPSAVRIRSGTFPCVPYVNVRRGVPALSTSAAMASALWYSHRLVTPPLTSGVAC